MITAAADRPPADLVWTFDNFSARRIFLCLVITAFADPFRQRHASDLGAE